MALLFFSPQTQETDVPKQSCERMMCSFDRPTCAVSKDTKQEVEFLISEILVLQQNQSYPSCHNKDIRGNVTVVYGSILLF